MLRVAEIIEAVKGQLLSGDLQLMISGVSIDSRTINSGELFIAIKGNNFDGHNFIQEAVCKGAKAVIMQDTGCYPYSQEYFRVEPLIDTQRENVYKPAPQAVITSKVVYIKVADTRVALADIARFHRQKFNIPIIAITGSNGKTTTKDMLSWVLSLRADVLRSPGTQNNDIGVPLTLLRLNISNDVGVLELGTNHFGEIDYLAKIAQPNFGIITNIGSAHLEHFKNLYGIYFF